LLRLIQRAGREAFHLVESALDRAFTPSWNPMHHLGALSFFFYWIVAVSGLYLYVVFDTSVYGAYASVEWITHDQWYLGGVMRSLHRYASDAMVVSVILHLSREFFMDRHRGFRWFSWLTGVPLLWLLFSSGINGYWLVWDGLAQYLAVNTAEWLDWLPVFDGQMARNFISQAHLSDRFFSLLVFLHIGIPLALLLGMWIHIQRITRARINPPAGLMLGTLAALLALSLIKPALSQGGQANLDLAVAEVGLDWFYLGMYPLIDLTSNGAVWWLLIGLTLLLGALPWMPPARRDPVAVVDLANCNGCARCFADCPFSAITMQPRSDGLPYAQEAVVNTKLCASCGLCAGACPTAMPFRRATELIPGIDLPQLPIAEIRDQVLAAAAEMHGEARVLVFGCAHGVPLPTRGGDATAAISLPCVGALPPSFIDFVLSRGHADGVVLAGCESCDCYFRLGIDWTEQRIARERDPQLRSRVPRDRLVTCWAGRYGEAELQRCIEQFRGGLAAPAAPRAAATDMQREPS